MWGFDNFKRGDCSFLGFIEKEPSIFLKSEVAPDSIHDRRTYVGEYVSDNARLKDRQSAMRCVTGDVVVIFLLLLRLLTMWPIRSVLPVFVVFYPCFLRCRTGIKLSMRGYALRLGTRSVRNDKNADPPRHC